MVHGQDLMLLFVLAASAVMGEVAVHLKETGSPQSAAVPHSSIKSALEKIGSTRPAGWELFEEAAKSLKKNERGAVSVTQIREAIKSLSERMGMEQGPLGVERWIKENLLPQATQTKAEMQHEVDAALQKVDDCGSLMWSAEKEVEHREKILLEDESSKYQCIAREHQLHKLEVDRCNDKLTFQRTLSPPTSINDVSKTPQAMKEALTLNYEFYNSAFPEFMNRKSACDDAANAAEAQLSECDADEAVIEEFYCKMKAGRDEACSRYDSCFSEQQAAMTAKITKVQALEQHVKEQFQSMSCFGNTFSEQAESECDPDAYETNHLDVVYPSTPRKQVCVSLMNTRRNYDEIVCNGEEVVTGNASRNHGNATEIVGGNGTGGNTTLF